MYKSKEIRWFVKDENKAIINWFSKHGINFSTIEPRTDFYLQIPDCDNMSIKLREGNIEVKQKHGQQVLYKLTNTAKGYLEDWVKWGFNISETDQSSNEIINLKKYNWIEIYKERLGIKITSQPGGSWQFHDIKEMLPAGCQLEYTRLKIKNEVWHTFAAEWFGDSFIELDKNKIQEITGDVILNESDSMSYNPFILRCIAKNKACNDVI